MSILCYARFLLPVVISGPQINEGGTGDLHNFRKQNFFFYVKSENIKFLHVNNVWDFSYLLNISDKN